MKKTRTLILLLFLVPVFQLDAALPEPEYPLIWLVSSSNETSNSAVSVSFRREISLLPDKGGEIAIRRNEHDSGNHKNRYDCYAFLLDAPGNDMFWWNKGVRFGPSVEMEYAYG